MTRISFVVERTICAYKDDTDTCYELVLFLQQSLFILTGLKEAMLFISKFSAVVNCDVW